LTLGSRDFSREFEGPAPPARDRGARGNGVFTMTARDRDRDRRGQYHP
jgi:hypothetical protein